MLRLFSNANPFGDPPRLYTGNGGFANLTISPMAIKHLAVCLARIEDHLWEWRGKLEMSKEPSVPWGDLPPQTKQGLFLWITGRSLPQSKTGSTTPRGE